MSVKHSVEAYYSASKGLQQSKVTEGGRGRGGSIPHDLDSDGSQIAGIKCLLQCTHFIQHTPNSPYISLAVIWLALQITSLLMLWPAACHLGPCFLAGAK